MTRLNLHQAAAILNELCFTNIAESWDNVGLLLKCGGIGHIERILVCNDLTDSVLKEALFSVPKTNLILSYHPPIFRPFKRFDYHNWKERILIECIKNDIAIFSPHTGIDSKFDGINDWLLSPLSIFKLHHVRSLSPKKPVSNSYWCSLSCTDAYNNSLKEFCLQNDLITRKFTNENAVEGLQVQVFDETFEELNSKALASGMNLKKIQMIPEICKENGCGRLGLLEIQPTIFNLIEIYKKLLGVSHLRLALGLNKSIESLVSCIATCAGSGASVLNNSKYPDSGLIDVFVTGEASHHEILDWVHKGITVIIAGHSNSERNYLPNKLIPLLKDHLPNVDICMSQTDKEPDPIV